MISNSLKIMKFYDIDTKQLLSFSEIASLFGSINWNNDDPTYWQEMIQLYFPHISSNALFYYDDPFKLFVQTSRYYKELLDDFGSEYNAFVEEFEQKFKCKALISTVNLAHLLKNKFMGTTNIITIMNLRRDTLSFIKDQIEKIDDQLEIMEISNDPILVNDELKSIKSMFFQLQLNNSYEKEYQLKQKENINKFKTQFEMFMTKFEESHPITFYSVPKEQHYSPWSSQAKTSSQRKKRGIVKEIFRDFFNNVSFPGWVKSTLSFEKLLKLDDISDATSFNAALQDLFQQMESSITIIAAQVKEYKELMKSRQSLMHKQAEHAKAEKSAETELEKQKNTGLKGTSAKIMEQNTKAKINLEKKEREKITMKLEEIDNRIDELSIKEAAAKEKDVDLIESNIIQYHALINEKLIPNIISSLAASENKLGLPELMIKYSPEIVKETNQHALELRKLLDADIGKLVIVCDSLYDWHVTFPLSNMVNKADQSKINNNTKKIEEIQNLIDKEKTNIEKSSEYLKNFNKNKSERFIKMKELEMDYLLIQKRIDAYKQTIEIINNDKDIIDSKFLTGVKEYKIWNTEKSQLTFLVDYDDKMENEDMKNAIHHAMTARRGFAKSRGESGVKYERPDGSTPYYKLKFPKGNYGNLRIKFEEKVNEQGVHCLDMSSAMRK